MRDLPRPQYGGGPFSIAGHLPHGLVLAQEKQRAPRPQCTLQGVLKAIALGFSEQYIGPPYYIHAGVYEAICKEHPEFRRNPYYKSFGDLKKQLEKSVDCFE
ncbi:hypothetical protein HNP48_002269 [Acidovorax soli]|uniref:Uncharacterized protein n=1 Tax=Acidovorax soli TaxID=592050 RepID=A0A7X0PCW8_9BURK|nr:hypothetical protein [Acidovorax soli]MBB6559602.1 hypothetical protein [Acidovorax soli]